MAFVLKAYGRALEKHRLLTNSVTASVLYGSGDFLAQMIEKRQHVQSTGKERYSYERTARMCVFGFFAAGPILGTWYGLLHRMTSTYRYKYVALQSSSGPSWLSNMGAMYRKDLLGGRFEQFREVLLKVGIDNLLFQSAFLNFYLLTMSSLEGLSIREGWARCKKNFHDAWAYSICFWSPAQYFNFSLVPAQYNALVVNLLCVVWLAFLSVLYHHRDYGVQAPAEEVHLIVELDGRPKTLANDLSEATGRFIPQGIKALADSTALAVDALCAFGARCAAAAAAARAAWRSRGDATEKEVEMHRLQDVVGSQRRQLEEQASEIQALQRTVAAQAVRLHLLQETNPEAGDAVADKAEARQEASSEPGAALDAAGRRRRQRAAPMAVGGSMAMATRAGGPSAAEASFLPVE